MNDQLHAAFHLPYRLSASVTPGPKPTVVLLHGIAASRSSWNNLIPELEGKYRIVNLDLLGFGDSPKPQSADYSAADHVRSIRYSLLRLGITGPVILIGHSMGALLAVHYAARYHRSVQRLILCSMPLLNDSETDTNVILKSWIESSTNLYLRVYRTLRERENLTLRGAKVFSNLSLRNFGFTLDQATWFSFCQSLENTIENQRTQLELPQLHMPIDLLYGQFDGLIIQPNLQTLVRLNPDMTLRTLPCSHLITKVYARAIANVLGL